MIRWCARSGAPHIVSHYTLCRYGQTGSGKTYTFAGGDDDDGVVELICNGVFGLLDEADGWVQRTA